MINNAGWTLVEIASRLLGSEEREAVLGDIFESNERAWQGLYSVLSLVVRKQALVWMSPKPWSAGLVVYGSSYLLMYVTISVCCTYQRLFLHRTFAWHMPTGNEGFFLLSCHVFLMLAWSWSAGFVVGSISRQTVWASGVLCAVPILFLWPAFQPGLLPRLAVILFLVPGILGLRHGLRASKVRLSVSVLLAVAVTVSMVVAWTNGALWSLNWLLIMSPWYLVSVARKA
jgi:hypothetical protein